jgi:tRNA-uridine 2-sulfurtransferase
MFLQKEKKNKKRKVAVGLSGGVDSAVSAYLLKEQGYEVTGVYMQCWDSKLDGCTADADRIDALKVATLIDIPFKYLNFVKEYKKRVIDHFYSEFQAGRTPNPDVLCNKEIKFGMFLKWAQKKGFDYVATGHYARVRKDGDTYQLLRGVDTGKDQSYFLYQLNQDQLSKALFPVGDMDKKALRTLAKEVGFHNADKPDSVGICFIGEVDIKEFLKDKIDTKPGNVIDMQGKVVGKHDGVQFYTIGQRRGFEISDYHKDPLYIVDKKVDTNELVVGLSGQGLKDNLDATDLHWISGTQPDTKFNCDVRIRHLGELYPAEVTVKDTTAHVQFEKNVFGIASGQSAVFYNEEVTLGGGIIL